MQTPTAPLDTTAAQSYEQLIVPALNAQIAAEIVELAALRPGESVLDAACGTGIVMRLAAPRVAPDGRVAGLDTDTAMIRVGSSAVAKPEGVIIDWHCASAQDMPFMNGSFDTAICLQGLQYFPNCAAALQELHRVLKPGGRFIAAVWTALEDCKGQYALAKALQRRKIDASPIMKAYSMGHPARIRELAEGAHFHDVEIRTSATAAPFTSVRQFLDAFAAGSLSSRAAISKIPEAERESFFREIEEELQPCTHARGVTLPLGYLTLKAITERHAIETGLRAAGRASARQAGLVHTKTIYRVTPSADGAGARRYEPIRARFLSARARRR